MNLQHPFANVRTLCALTCACVCSAALAQEAMYTNAATMPGPGIMSLRIQPHIFRYGASPSDRENPTRNTTVYSVMNSLQIGIAPEVSLNLDMPAEYRRDSLVDGSTDNEAKFPELDAMVKWRFYRDDRNNIDTTRIALLLGAKADFDDEFNVDPHIGIVFTNVSGRHGWNFELHYTLTTGGTGDRLENLGGEGTADLFATNFAYVYRIIPEAYTSQSVGAWYLTGELNSMYETNSDYELHFSPGLMYEGRRFGFEVMGKVPVYQDVSERPELDWGFGFGFRFLF